MALPFNRIKKILIVRMRHLGDVLLTTPVLTHLHQTFPEAQIDVFINQESLPMLEGHPAVSHFFLYNRRWKKLPFIKKLWNEWKLLWQVRSQKYDLVFNLTEGDRGALVALISNAPYRVGFDPGQSGFLWKRKIFTHLVKICPHPRHTVERQLDALRAIGIHPSIEERDLFFSIPSEVREKMKRLCSEGFILIHPISRWMFKSPPASFFIELIQELQNRGEKVVLTGGSEQEGLEYINEIINAIPGLHNLAGQTTLKELGALIELSRLLITVDSVPLHIASALKAPTIALFGPSSEVNWGPWKNPFGRVIAANVSCRPCYMDGCGGSKKSDCLRQISVKDVLATIDESLGRNRLPAPLCFAGADPQCQP